MFLFLGSLNSKVSQGSAYPLTYLDNSVIKLRDFSNFLISMPKKRVLRKNEILS